jgi:CheY-like chemotaxis protein
MSGLLSTNRQALPRPGARALSTAVKPLRLCLLRPEISAPGGMTCAPSHGGPGRAERGDAVENPLGALAAVQEPRYVVTCDSCRAPFDALAAVWCSCLATERTLACPSCGRCFCKAGASYKNRFWSAAPKELWDAKWCEHRQAVARWETPPEGALAHGPLVLLVDDEEDIRRVATAVLRGLGCQVVLARDGVEGLALARALKPDLVLTDALMPHLDGREMCQQLKADPVTAGIPVVVMTALYTGVRYRMEGFKKYGANEYITKPVEATELSAVVQRLVYRLTPATESAPAGSSTRAAVGSSAQP